MQAFKIALKGHKDLAEPDMLSGTRAELVCRAAAVKLDQGKVPTSLKKALDGPFREEWLAATAAELEKLSLGCTMMQAKDVPDGVQILPSRVVLTEAVKDSILKRKVRFAVRGDMDNTSYIAAEVFAIGYNKCGLRIYLAVSTSLGLQIDQADVTGAYISAPSETVTYMRLPPGLEGLGVEKDTVLRFHNAIYGTHTAGRSWSKHNNDIMVNHLGFTQSEVEPSIYTKTVGGSHMMIHIATDDFLIAHDDAAMRATFIEDYQQFAPIRFEGKAEKYLSWNIKQEGAVTTVDQCDYIAKLGEMYNAKPLPATKVTPLKLSDAHMPSQDGPESVDDALQVDNKRVFELYGQLNWLATGTRPDIREALSELGRCLKCPSHKLWRALLHLVAYLVSTADEKLVYGNADQVPGVVAYCDAGHNPHSTQGKSRMGYFIKVNGAAVIWDSRLQSVIAQSTTEAEYICMAEVCKSIMYASMLIEELGVKYTEPIRIRCDNQSAITISNNGSTNRQTRHIAVRYHLIRRCIQLGLVRPEFVPGNENPADQLTKRLCESKTTACRVSMMTAAECKSV